MDKGTNQNGDRTKEPIQRTMGQRNQSKWRKDKGTNQKDDRTKKQPILTIKIFYDR